MTHTVTLSCTGFKINRKLTRVGIDKKSNVTFGKIVDDRSLRKVCHVCQIFEQLVLWRILFFDLVI